MKVSIAYLFVVLIWSTTPLGIIWSSESVNPTLAVLLRMLIATVLGSLFLVFLRIKLPINRQAVRLYCYSTLGIFGGMTCGYLASRYVTSGFMSLVFGLSPIISGLLAQRILNEAKFSQIRLAAFIICISGLAVICWENITVAGVAPIGVILVVMAMFLFSLSAVLVKSIQLNIHPLATTLGSLYFSLPLFFVTWYVTASDINIASWSLRSIASIAYLGLFGSLIGFIAYFFILQKLSASKVALITLITPTFAISLGAMVNHEPITINLIVGALCIMLGLALYHWGEKYFLKRQQLVAVD